MQVPHQTEDYIIEPKTTVFGNKDSARPLPEIRKWLDDRKAGSVSKPKRSGRSKAVSVGGATLFLQRGNKSTLVHPGAVTFHDWEGFEITVVIDVADEPRPHAFAQEVRIARRPGGSDPTARGIQAAHIGEAIREAVEELSDSKHGKELAILAMQVGKPRNAIQEEIEITAIAHNEAQTAGLPVRAAVAKALSKERNKHLPKSAKEYSVEDVMPDVGNRIRQARERGRIESAGGTTRPVVTKGKSK